MQLTIIKQRGRRLILSTLLLCLLPFNANALKLADQPLTMSGVTSAVPPNVMLLMDSSGSMANMLWSDAYDPKITYPNWLNDNKSYGDLNYDKNTNYSEATLNGETRWLKLPEPDGRNTDYDDNYLNFLFDTAVYDVSNRADLTVNNLIPQITRITAAKNAATSLVSDPNNASMRFGVFKFNKGTGGTLEATCGTNTPTLLSKINGLTADSSTPLAETYHDITKYFRGEGNFTSPIQYRCQQNFVIVVTDGYPTKDITFDEPNPLYAARLPDWDGLSPMTLASDFPLSIPQYSDGFAPNDPVEAKTAGASLYLDDLAKFGYDIDLMPTGTNDDEGNDYDMAPFAKQNLVTHTIGFATDNQMLADAADNTHGRGTYTPTASAAGLSDALNSALSSIKASAQLKSISTSAISSGYLTDATRIYMTSYANVGNDWTGDIVKYKFVNKVLTVDTDDPITVPADPANRSIYTYDGSSEVLFNDSLGATEKNILCPANMPAPSTDANPACTATKVTALIDYLAGGVTGESAGTFRARSSGLGDIINSAPAYLTKPSFRYPETLIKPEPGGTNNYDELYSEFRSGNQSRSDHILVGSNSGMLHAFNVSTGNETMAYVPRMILSKLKSLSDLNYSHEYFVDGSPTIGDAYYGTTWHTVLASGMNKGAQGVFALDITDLSDLTTLNPWEFTDADDVNMGYSFSQPAIVLMSNGKWAAVFGNGFNSNEADGNQGPGNAVLYIVYLGVGENGFVANEFEVLNTKVTDKTQGGDNGLATVAPVDIDGDFDIDIIYAGDLNGNVWKFNVSSSDSSTWKGVDSISKLYSRCANMINEAETTCLELGNQAITTRPEVGRGPMSNSFMVYFGTGKYLENSDPNDMSVQSFYAILDESLANTTTVSSGQLQEQTIVQQGSSFAITDPDDPTSTLPLADTMRVTSDTVVDYSAKKGWYIDLTFENVTQGERVISNPSLRNGRIIVTTNYYTSSGGGGNNNTLSCNANAMSASGKGWIMEFEAINGSRLAYSPFDIDGDGTIGIYDTIRDGSQEIVVSGKRFGENIASPSILANGTSEIILTSGSDGTTKTTLGNAGPGADGIQGWTQL